MFDFRLQVFYTVAKRLSFTKAAEELFITQPAVTKHIHELEGMFNLELFNRTGGKVQLTAAGETLLHHTEQVFELYRNMQFDMNALTQKHGGKLRIGASTSVAQYVLPQVLASFHKKVKDVDIKLDINNTQQVEEALLNKTIDLGIIEGQSKQKGLKYTGFVKDEIVLVSSINNPLAKKQTINAEELKKIPLLLREPGSGTLQVISHALKPLGIKLSQLKVEMQMASSEGMKNYLLYSNSMAFLSIHSVIKELQNRECCIIDVKGLNIERYFYFIQPQGQTGGLPALFMQFALQYNFKL